MLIELLGLPGVGKTTLAQCLNGATSHASFAARSWLKAKVASKRQVLKAYHSRLRYPKATKAGELLLQGMPWSSPADASKAVEDWRIAVRSAHLRRHSNSDCVFLDHGIFQTLWSIGWGTKNGELSTDWAAAIRRCPLPDVVVVLRLPLQDVATRIEQRACGQSRLERQRDRRAALHRGISILGQVEDVIREVYAHAPDSYKVVELQADAAPDACAAVIRDVLDIKIRHEGAPV